MFGEKAHGGNTEILKNPFFENFFFVTFNFNTEFL
jgi:hypothetical protein